MRQKTARRLAKRIVIWAVVIAALTGLGWSMFSQGASRPPSYTGRPVHWHALFDIKICSEPKNLLEYDPGRRMVGPMLTHTHGDNKMHIEGQVNRPEEIKIGGFMEALNIPFSATTIKSKTNGDSCPDGQPGMVKMFVNGQPNTDFREYVPKDGDAIRIVFEP